MFVYATALGAALAIGKREHITISVAVERLPRRLQAFSDRFALMLLALLNVVMVLESISWIQITGDYLMPATGLPRIVAQVCVPIGCGIALVYCGLRIWNPAKPAGSADAAG